jgi:type I site-specific restriction endonuclease
VDKKALSERDICTKYITPAIAKGGWDVQVQVRENVHLGISLPKGTRGVYGTQLMRTSPSPR